MHEALGVAAAWTFRRDVIANQGTAADYQPQIFLEDRTMLTTALGDEAYITLQNSAGTWTWTRLTALGSAGGGIF